ncbi:MAG: LptF/LptG family permease, partial [Candidatus Hydrogenedentes bacterium]|nr:LptF/LptG family permease [Candidatus Hydrogenedentota bacterium]
MLKLRSLYSILTRYSLREILVPAALAMAIIGFVGVANELRERRVALPLEYLSGWDVARLILYFSPTLFAYLIPIAYMMGILLAFGRLAQHNEITAMKAAGIPLKRLVVPVVLVGAVLSVGTFFLQDRVQPRAMDHANQLLYVELPQRITLDVLPVGVMNDFGGIRVSFKTRDAEKKLFGDIVVVQPKTGRDWIFYAESAQFVDSGSGALLVLRNGHQIMPQKGDSVMPILFDEQAINLNSPALRPPPAQHRAMMLTELIEREKKSAARYQEFRSRPNAENLRTLRSEISDRVTLPLACLA